jgi:preprotein translocase subunit SecF
MTYAEAANLAVNQTLVRSINTSIVALLPVASILFVGGAVLGTGTLLDLSLALFVGIAVGTYSSVFLATPLLVHLRSREARVAAQARRVAAKRASRTDEPTRVPATMTAPAAVGDGAASEAPDADATADGGGRSAVPAPARRPSMRRPSGGQRPQPRRSGRR